MNRNEIIKRWPNASESCIQANLDPDRPRENPIVERASGDEPLAPDQGQEGTAGRVHIRFVSFRQRLCDPDNLSCKYLLDALRFSGAIHGDEPEKISLEVTQQKVKLKSDERTVITIEPL